MTSRPALASWLCRRAILACAVLLGILAAPANAAPCGKPGDAIDAALCAHRELRDLDENLNRTITEARGRRGLDERRTIGKLAKTWYDDRIELCPKANLVCLRLIYQDQIAFWSRIDGTPGHSDRLRFIRFFHQRPKTNPDQGSFSAEFIGFAFADPTTGAQKQFNHDVEAAIADVRKAVADDGDPSMRSAVESYSNTAMHAPTWTGRLLSVRLMNDSFSGGAHGLQNTWNLNLEAEAPRKFRLADRFTPRTLDTMMATCANRLAAETSNAGFNTRSEIYARDGRTLQPKFRALMQRANRWSLTGHRVILSIPEYTLGGMALGQPTCEIDSGELAAMGGCVDRSEP